VPGGYSLKALLPITVTIVTVIRRRLYLRRFFYFAHGAEEVKKIKTVKGVA
jgi:hypothetical protein